MSEFNFAVNSEAVASIHGEGIVILHAGNGRIYASNAAGAYIWRAVQRRLQLEAIADEFSTHYQIARATAREHSIRFLTELERQSLIRREGVL